MHLLEMRGITKRYSVNQVLANDGAELTVDPGEIHALVGENGAGKTTLVKILDGMESYDSGRILLRGTAVAPRSPREAMDLGIGMVHQHLRLIPELTVAENITLGIEPRRFCVFIHAAAAAKTAAKAAAEYGFSIDPAARVKDLSLSEMQQVEIVKVLYRRADLIILDEPTTGLTEGQVQRLFAGLKSLVSKGKTIILISHKLREVLEVSDRVTVMRKGKTVAVRNTGELTEEALAALTIGGESGVGTGGSRKEKGPCIYEFRDVTLTSRGRRLLHRVSFRIHAGEILAIAGVSGNGLAELEDTVCGLRKPTEGRIYHAGEDVTCGDPRRLRRLGMAFVPSNRLFRGVSLEANVRDNLLLSRRAGLECWGWQLRKPITAFVGQLLRKFGVETEPGIPVGYLSGGNIQKVILARELSAGKDFGLFSEPTWGIDAASTKFVQHEILALRDRGCAILLISTDLDEILALSDRVAVMHRGSIVAVFSNTGGLSKESIGLAMLGSPKNGWTIPGQDDQMDALENDTAVPRKAASPEQAPC